MAKIHALLMPSFLFLLAFFLYYRNGTWGGLPTDNAVYLYWGQQLLAGTLPYVSLFDQKGPGAGFVVGFFILVGRALHYSDDVRPVMIGFMLNNALTALLIFVTARALTRNVTLALLAYGVFLLCYPLAVETSRAPEPKILIMMLQLAAMQYAVRSRWLEAGLVCMSAMVIWQPSVTVTIAAGVILARYRHPLRDYLRFGVGLSLPFAACVLVYAWAGALPMLFEGLIGFNLFDYQKPPFAPLAHLKLAANWMVTWFRYYSWVPVLAGCGFMLQPFCLRPADTVSRRYVSFLRCAIGLWLAWTAFDFGFNRLFLLVPYGAIGFALLLACAIKNLPVRLYEAAMRPAAAWVALAGVILAVFYSQASIGEKTRLRAQQAMVDRIDAESLHTSDVLACGSLPYNVLSKTTDVYNPYDVIFRNQSIVVFIDRTYPGKRQGMAAAIMERKPKLIVMGYENACSFVAPENRKTWNEWLQTHYLKYSIKPDDALPPDTTTLCLACWPLPDGKGALTYYLRK